MFDVNKVDRNVELFIFDIYIAILKIKKVAGEFDNAENLQFDFRSWDSVIREFEIIGEASKYLLRDRLLSQNYQVLVDFRNKITHEYFGIDNDIVWSIIDGELGDIENVVLSLINKIELNLKQELVESFIIDNNYLDFVVKELKKLRAPDEK